MDWERFYSTFREPDFIPGYEIQNRLGGGAFGEVYKATKTSIGKAYAIKFLKIEDEAQRDVVERELRHVRHFAVIDHPNLVSIEDMGIAMGVPYLVMGYAGEDTLARRLRRTRLERDEALGIFGQTCRGVLALHDRRLVHFDLKPGNVFLRGDVARVGDYGLARLMAEGHMTLSFGRGTPHYMAPEMLQARADHRADVYSLGVILYECLTGELPFATSDGLVQRDGDEPPGFPDGFPAGLRSPIEAALRPDPERRCASVGDLLEAVGGAAEGRGAPERARARGGGAAELARAAWAELRRADDERGRSGAPGARGTPGASDAATPRTDARAVVERVHAERAGAEPPPPAPPGPIGRAGGRLLREGAAIGGGLVRLVVFLAFMAALGAGVTMLVLMLLGGGP